MRQKRTSKRVMTAAVGATVLGLSGQAAQAAMIGWDGGPGNTGTSWNVPANWFGDVLPASGDTVAFSTTGLSANKVISLDASHAVHAFQSSNFNGTTYTIGNATDVVNGNTLMLSHVLRGSSAFSSTVTVAANVLLGSTINTVFTDNNNTSGAFRVTGSISGAGKSLSKYGGGTLELANANPFDGGTTVAGGTLNLNFNAATSPTSNILASGSALTLAGGTLSTTGKAGTAHAQTLGGLSLGSGASGASIANGNASGTTLVNFGAITRTTGATVNFVQPTVNAAIGAGNGFVTSTGNDASGILGAYATVGGANWATNNGTNVVAYTGYADLADASPVLGDNATANVRLTTGSTGDVTQAAGTTTINTLLANGTTARTLSVGGGNTLRFGAVGGVLTPSGTGALTIGAAGDAGTLTAGGADDVAGELVVNNATAITVNATIADNGNGAVALTKAGAGTLTLAAASTFTGGATVNAGTLTLPVGDDRLSTTGAIAVNGGTLSLGGTQNTSGAVTFRGGTTAGGTIVKTGGDYAAEAGTVTTVLGGAVNLVKTTTGILTLSANNTYTGETRVLEGTINATVNGATKGNIVVGSVGGGAPAAFVGSGVNAVADSKSVTVYKNGSFTLGNGDNITTLTIVGGTANSANGYVNGTITMTGGTIGSGSIFGNHAAIVAESSDATALFAGSLVINATQTFTVANGAAANDLRVTGGITNNSGNTSGVVKAGAGVMTAEGNNTYVGATTIRDGALVATSLNKIVGRVSSSSLGAPTTIANGTIALGSTTTTGQLTYRGAGETTDRVLNLAGTTGGGTVDQSGGGVLTFTGGVTATGAGSKTLTLQGDGAGEIGGAIVNNSASNKTSLTKAGSGTWALSGTSTYTGATTVSDGLLLVNGALANTAVTVDGGALGGAGTIGGPVSITAGSLAPGNSIGTLTINNSLTITGTLDIEASGADGGSIDLLDGITTLDITTASVDFSVLSPLDDAVYVFATYDTLIGTFASANVFNLPGGYDIDYDYQDANQIALVAVAVPEPAAATLLLLGGTSILKRRRRIPTL